MRPTSLIRAVSRTTGRPIGAPEVYVAPKNIYGEDKAPADLRLRMRRRDPKAPLPPPEEPKPISQSQQIMQRSLWQSYLSKSSMTHITAVIGSEGVWDGGGDGLWRRLIRRYVWQSKDHALHLTRDWRCDRLVDRYVGPRGGRRETIDQRIDHTEVIIR